MTDEAQPPVTIATVPPATGRQVPTALVMYEGSKRSIPISYVLWFFAGMIGGHRFYNGRIKSGIAQVLLGILGFVTVIFLVGFAILIGLAIWVLVDAFLIPAWVENYNKELAKQFGLTGTA